MYYYVGGPLKTHNVTEDIVFALLKQQQHQAARVNYNAYAYQCSNNSTTAAASITIIIDEETTDNT